MKHRTRLVLLMWTGILLISGCKPKTQDLDLMYEKYTLQNGLEVILHPDHSDPIVAVAIQYHVGSNREEPGKTGFAHFFEHMLFQASENLGRDEFFTKIENLGGDFNGGTWQDGTVYYEVVPNDALEKILWMESDRMGFFINTVSEAGLKREIDVVVNEKRQTQDNRPYGFTTDVIQKNLFPKGHPYSWTVIGEMADLKGATIEDVKNFYNKYYGTNNATLVIAGDFETDEVKALVEKYFGEIKPREEVAPLKAMPPVVEQTKHLYYEDQFANMPELSIVFPTVEMYHPDSYALDMLTTLLSEGKKAPLYKVIVEDRKLAPRVSMYNNSQEIAGTTMVRIRAFEPVDLDEVYTAVQEAFNTFEAKGVDEKELQAIKNMAETNFYQGMASLLSKSFQIAQANVFAGTPDQIMTDVEKIRQVSVEDILRVYNVYIKGKNHLTTSFVPMGKTDLTVKGAEKADVVIEDASQQDFEADGQKIVDAPYEKTHSAFDRSAEPALGKELSLKTPQIWTDTLSNGIKLYGVEQDELPLVHFALTLQGGTLFESPAKSGVAQLTTQLMNEGSETKTPEEMEEALKLLGATVSISLEGERISINGYCLAHTYDQVMELVKEKLFHPRWDVKEFERLQQAALSGIQQEMVNPSSIASRVFMGLVYGKESILGQSQRGTLASISSITLDDLKAYYQSYFAPNLATFHIAGKIAQEQAKASAETLLGSWTHEVVSAPAPEIKTIQPTNRLFFVDIPGATQSYILAGKKAMPRGSEEYYPATLVNFRLGEGTGSRLFTVLRLEKGYTYGAYSYYSSQNYKNLYVASSSVQGSVTAESVTLFKELIGGYKDSFNEEDLTMTQGALIRKKAGAYETLSALLDLLTDLSSYQLPMDFIKQNEIFTKNLTLDQARSIIENSIKEEELIYVVVGDATSQLGNLKACGMGDPVLLDREGNPVK